MCPAFGLASRTETTPNFLPTYEMVRFRWHVGTFDTFVLGLFETLVEADTL